jgi:hypothetical protein
MKHQTLYAASKTVSSIVRSKKSNGSWYAWIFMAVLLLVAIMSFMSMSHLHAIDAQTPQDKTLSSFLRVSEDQLVNTAEKLLDAINANSNYLQQEIEHRIHARDHYYPVHDLFFPHQENEHSIHGLETPTAPKVKKDLDIINIKGVMAPTTETVQQKPTKKRLAYAITITKDGFFQDGAAVLAYSILKYSKNSRYDISFIAFVHPNVTTSRVGLRRLGFHVIEVPTPVNTKAIEFPFLRDHIDKNGCCGATELIKLTSYR